MSHTHREDRIQDIASTGPPSEEGGYSSSSFGVWGYAADAKRFEVRIRFTGWAARVVAERQWHSSQSITPLKKDGSEIEFCAELAGLEELTRWVISHGRHAQAIEPPELKRRVKNEL